ISVGILIENLIRHDGSSRVQLGFAPWTTLASNCCSGSAGSATNAILGIASHWPFESGAVPARARAAVGREHDRPACCTAATTSSRRYSYRMRAKGGTRLRPDTSEGVGDFQLATKRTATWPLTDVKSEVEFYFTSQDTSSKVGLIES